VLEGAEAKALEASGWDVGVLAWAEAERMGAAGVGPEGGLLRPRGEEPSALVARLWDREGGGERLRSRAAAVLRRSFRVDGLPLGVRSRIFGLARGSSVEARPSGGGAAWEGTRTLALAAADVPGNARYTGKAPVDGAPGWAVQLEVEPTLDGEQICTGTLRFGGEGLPGPTPSAHLAVWVEEGRVRELRASFPAGEVVQMWYEATPLSGAIRLFAWVDEQQAWNSPSGSSAPP
jgi:hypothetical protein